MLDLLNSIYSFPHSHHLWNEGLLIDFLQKKSADSWIKKFLILSANIFNERQLFDFVILFPISIVLRPMSLFSFFESNNIASTIRLTMLMFAILTIIILLLSIFIFCF